MLELLFELMICLSGGGCNIVESLNGSETVDETLVPLLLLFPLLIPLFLALFKFCKTGVVDYVVADNFPHLFVSSNQIPQGDTQL